MACDPRPRLGGLVLRSVEAIPYVVPLLRPIAWARGQLRDVDNVLVRVTLSDGTQGIADAPARPTILGETQKSIVAIVNDHLAPQLTGLDAWDVEGLWKVLGGFGSNHAAKAALDLALHDAQAKALGIECAALLGGVLRPLPVSWRLSMAPHEQMLRDAHAMRERHGFRAFKVKGSTRWQDDVDFMRKLRKAFGDEISISVDFNQCLDARSLLKALPHLEELGVGPIEEPLPARDAHGKQLCAQKTSIPISGDDSCFTPEDVLHELKLGAIGEVVLKVARSGYRPARDIAALCRAFYVPMHCGTQADMHIGTCAAAHFACTFTALHEHEFSTFLDAADHLGDRAPVVRDGHLVLPPGPGIGVAVDEAKLDKYRIDR